MNNSNDIEFIGKLNNKAIHRNWLYYQPKDKSFLSFLIMESGTPWLILIDEPNTKKVTLTNIIEEAYQLAWHSFKDYIPHDKILDLEFLYKDSEKKWNRVKFNIQIKTNTGTINLIKPRWEICDDKFIEMFQILVTG